MKVQGSAAAGVTCIDNAFIDRFMAAANGEYVKIYLYLLRCVSSGRSELDISDIADFLDNTESDVRRALSYWERAGLIKSSSDEKGALQSLLLLPPREAGREGRNTPLAAQAALGSYTDAASDSDSNSISSQGRLVLTPLDLLPEASKAEDYVWKAEDSAEGSSPKIAQFHINRSQDQSREVLRRLVFSMESYFNRPLSSQDQSNLDYFLNTLHMPEDLIDYLVTYCVDKHHEEPRYMERIANDWVKAGITTVEQARAETKQHDQEYREIFKAFGLSRAMTDSDVELFKSWLEDYGFSREIILVAAKKTCRSTSKPSLNYAETILASWHKNGVKNMEDIEALDKKHGIESKEVKEVRALMEKGSQKRQSSGRSKGRKNDSRFNNFEQRDLDWDKVEDLVIASQKASQS